MQMLNQAYSGVQMTLDKLRLSLVCKAPQPSLCLGNNNRKSADCITYEDLGFFSNTSFTNQLPHQFYLNKK